MHLIQILLPLFDNDGVPFTRDLHDGVREELSRRFGGLTAFTRAPAEGHWREEGRTARDDIVVFEVMTEALDPDWWRAYRRELGRTFKQEVIVIRAQEPQLP